MRLNIAPKLGFWLSVLAILSAGVTGYYAYRETRTIVVRGEENKLLTATRVLTKRFTGVLEESAKDVRLLAGTPDVLAVVSSLERAQRVSSAQKRRVAELFIAMLQQHKEYFQIRLIGAAEHGLELVRVDRNQTGLSQAGPGLLQEKAHFPYVFRTLRLPSESVYVSEIEVNRELGRHVGHNRPAVRIATPLHGDDGVALAVVVINVELDGLMRSMGIDLPPGLQLYLTNEQGDYLIHPDVGKQFGFDLGRRYLVQDDIPQTGHLIANHQHELVLTTEGSTADQQLVAAFVRLPFGDFAKERFALLGLAAPLPEVYRETLVLRTHVVQIVLGASLLAILVSFGLSQALSKPLLQLVSAIKVFPGRPEDYQLPLKRRDEIGLLAGTILTMVEQIQHQLRLLEDSERRLNRAQETAGIGNWEVDLISGQVLWSDQQYRLLGYEPGLVTANLRNFLRAVHPVDRKRMVHEIRRITRGQEKQGYQAEHRVLLPGGAVKVVEERAEFHYAGHQQPVHLFGTTLDITRRKATEDELRYSHRQLQSEAMTRDKLIEELEAKNAELERFTYTVSHDLKSPLVTVNGFLGMLKADLEAGDRERVAEDVAYITEAAHQMGRLLDELLELSRVGRGNNLPEVLSLNAVVSQAVDLLRGAIENSDAEIIIDENLPAVLGDRNQLVEVMQNLLDNALKFTSAGSAPQIRISALEQNNEVVCCVADRGIGIDPRYHDRVFELFERLDPRIEGTGIGLALVKRIIEVQNGKVWIEHDQGNQGTRICFSLPRGPSGLPE